jgi:catechol 2,3-dioxygenase-like lactoylglutathione lyase family enzyme
MTLDHATIVTKDVAAMRRFFRDVAGLHEGPRPAFGVGGCWLYADGRALIHLIESATAATAAKPSPRIDHVALRVEGGEAWAALLERLRQNRIPYELAEVPSAGELQLFVGLAPGVTIEFIKRAANAADAISEP